MLYVDFSYYALHLQKVLWCMFLQLANEGFSPNVKKDRKKFGLRKKKSSKGSSVDLTGSSPNKTTEPESASPLSVSFPGTEVFG